MPTEDTPTRSFESLPGFEPGYRLGYKQAWQRAYALFHEAMIAGGTTPTDAMHIIEQFRAYVKTRGG